MDIYDPDTWTKEYAASDSAECFARLKEVSARITDCLFRIYR